MDLDGHRGLYLELHSPTDLDYPACGPVSGMLIWEAGERGDGRVLEAPATDRYWIIDVGGRAYGAATSLTDVAALFVERVEDYRAIVERADPGGIATSVAGALSEARRVVVPPGLPPEWLTALGGIEVVTDAGTLTAEELDRLDGVITAAAVGIAVTGTIVLDHSPDQGRRALSLVPDLHVCLVHESQLVADVPESIAPLREPVAAGRPLTWISGPSATSDIELERVEGVHGPRTLHVLLVSSPG